MRMHGLSAVMLMAAVVWGGVGHAAAPAGEYVNAEHKLVGKIWDVAAKQFITAEALAGELRRADYVLLGETHDNRQHHEYQSWAIEQLLKAARRPPVAFEMITPAKLSVLPAQETLTSDALFDALEWDKSGWPARDYYRPLFDTVLAAELPIRAANLERADLRAMVVAGPTGLPEDIAVLVNSVVLSEQDKAGLREEIAESHCGMLPEQHVDALSLSQRVRDAVMGRALADGRGEHGVVLIAGNGHVRLDRGVPAYVRAADPARSLRAVAWQEVRAEMQSPQDYAAVWAAPSLPFDFVWFTARVERPDPCEEFREHVKKMGNGGAGNTGNANQAQPK